MEQGHHLAFGPFHIDGTQGRLWRGEQGIALRPQSLALLRYLVAHPGRLVTKAEVRQHVWVGTHVTDTVLRVSVHEIRQALGDGVAAPRYLETVGGQGYRFLLGEDDSPPPLMTGPLVGRQSEVEAVAQRFQRAAQGTRQLVLVSGEAGIGKTTVVEMVLAHEGPGRGVRIARGQCAEHYGEGEPYLPILEALGQLCRGPRPADVLAVLRRYAPLWLVQLLGVLSEAELERLQRQVQGATAGRMLRELAEALEVLSADVPLLLVLEDLQWSDRSTVEALAYLAQRRGPARLLVLGTYRPVEVALRAHPLRGMVQELGGRGQAVDMRLELLPAEAVTAYVTERLGGPVAAPLAALIFERTEGNALFLVNIVEHLVQQGWVVWRAGQWTLRVESEAQVASLPEGIRQLLLRRLQALPPEVYRVLEAASVVGKAFTVAAVAASSQVPVEDVETVCEGLAAQQHLIDDAGLRVWPDGTRGGRYRFQHALYQQVLYEQIGTARRGQLHRRIGVRLEAGYGAQVGKIAAQLAVHFERSGATAQAVRYAQQAADNAVRRNAHHEAVTALRKGLALLATLPESPERSQRELVLHLTLGELLRTTQGVGAPDVGDSLHPSLSPGPAGGGDAAAHSGPLGTVAVSYEPWADGDRRRVGAAAPRAGATPTRHGVRGGGAFCQGDDGELSGGLPRRPRPAGAQLPPRGHRALLRAAPAWGICAWSHPAHLAGAGTVDVRLCRPGPAAGSGGADPGPPGGPYPHAGVCGIFCGPRLPVPPRRGGGPGACRHLAHHGRCASPGPARGAGSSLAGVGARHAGRGGRRGGTPPPGIGVSRRGTRVAALLLARRAGRGVWPGGAAPGWAPGPDRGGDADGHDRDALVGGRGVSAPGGVAAPTPEPRGPPGGSVFPAGPRGGPPAAGQGVRTPGRAEPESTEAAAEQRQAARELLAPIYGWFTEGFDTSDLRDAKALLEELA